MSIPVCTGPLPEWVVYSVSLGVWPNMSITNRVSLLNTAAAELLKHSVINEPISLIIIIHRALNSSVAKPITSRFSGISLLESLSVRFISVL